MKMSYCSDTICQCEFVASIISHKQKHYLIPIKRGRWKIAGRSLPVAVSDE